MMMRRRGAVLLSIALCVAVGLMVVYQQDQTRVSKKKKDGTIESSETSSASSHYQSSRPKNFQLAPGELPGYTGWARPEHTLAGHFALVQPTAAVATTTNWTAVAGENIYFTIKCQKNHATDCQASSTSWFFVRAYGPAIVTGQVEKTNAATYQVRFRPQHPGTYTVEVVLTFSNPPDINSFPHAGPPTYYEGYLLPDFPATLTVLPASQPRIYPQSDCTVDQLTETSPDSAYDKAAWKVVDQVRHENHAVVTQRNSIHLTAYQRAYNGLGVNLQYEYTDCKVMPRPNARYNPFACLQPEPLHILLIGDSTMRLQRDVLESFVKEYDNIRITFHELYGGALRCEHLSYPNVTAIADRLAKQSKDERRVIVFNTGLHDIHRLCGAEYANDRKTYLKDPQASCTAHYRVALQHLADNVARIPAAVKIFQTTTAGWPKYGNYGLAWDPRYGQTLPLDAAFVEHFNRLAFAVLQTYSDVSIVDGYWISLARPDNREIDAKSSTGKKLSHPGVEVVLAMVRIWSMVVLKKLCK